MSKVPEGVSERDLYVASRQVLLDALYALKDQQSALILIGAQAVYLRSQEASIAVAAFTADADLGIDRGLLGDLPRLEEAMKDAGFALSTQPRPQPGQWFRTVQIEGRSVEIPVDLLIPELFSETARRRRSANLPPHDQRAADVKVAGVAALLTAKAFKIHDRSIDTNPGRVSDKDAGDVIRLMVASDLRSTAATFGELFAHPDERIRDTARVGIEYLKEQFGRVRGVGVQMAEQALAGAMPVETIRGLATAFTRELPDG